MAGPLAAALRGGAVAGPPAGKLHRIRLAAVLWTWQQYSAGLEWQRLTVLRVAKRLSDLYLARAWQQWHVAHQSGDRCKG